MDSTTIGLCSNVWHNGRITSTEAKDGMRREVGESEVRASAEGAPQAPAGGWALLALVGCGGLACRRNAPCGTCVSAETGGLRGTLGLERAEGQLPTPQ